MADGDVLLVSASVTSFFKEELVKVAYAACHNQALCRTGMSGAPQLFLWGLFCRGRSDYGCFGLALKCVLCLLGEQEVATRKESLRSQRSHSAEVDVRELLRQKEVPSRIQPRSG